MYVVIEQLFEDLNSYCESFVALPEAPHTKYVSEAIKGAFQSGKQAVSANRDPLDGSRWPTFTSPSSPFSKLTGDREQRGSFSVNRENLAEAITPSQANEDLPFSIGETAMPTDARPNVRRASTDHHSISSARSPPSPASSRDGFADVPVTSSRKDSESSGKSTDGRPNMARSKTLAALAVSETTVNAISGTNVLAAEKDKDRSDSVDAQRSGASSAMTRATSSESTSTVTGTSDKEQGLEESIMSLRTVGASSNALYQQRKSSGGERQIGTSLGAVPPAAMLAPGKREPPHGLGRTVRDAINLKLFPTYPNPKDIQDWDVPVTLLDLRKRVTGNWDLTMCRVLPFIDGINHVKRIAQLADADLELTRQCVEHLLYYRCVITTDTFQFTNMYTVRPSIAVMAEDDVIIAECASYVTKPGHVLPVWPRLLGLYSSLRPAVTINEWIEENDVEAMGIDVRRFVSFGVIKGFLRRVHRYPILLQASPSPLFFGRRDASQGGVTERDPSTSRSRERVARVREESLGFGTNGQLSPEASGPRLSPNRRRQASENESVRGAGTSATGSAGRKRFSEQHSHRKTRATVMDVANVALDAAAAKEQESANMNQTPGRVSIRTPLPRGSSTATLRANAMSASRDSDEAGAAVSQFASGTSASLGRMSRAGRQASVKVPPGFLDLLDGTHPDDEFCVRFGISWSDVLAILIHIGRQSQKSSAGEGNQTQTQTSRMTSYDDDGTIAANGVGEADESGIANLSGIVGAPGAQGQRRSVGASLPLYRRTGGQQGAATSMQSGFSRYASTGDGTSGWGRVSGIQSTSIGHDDDYNINRESIARGDLGGVKIIVK